ncbi:AbiTii domain-containing protein [Cellulosimicrobium cellulans]|uniref:AbiTii domain-containing protein n=1 Tax=Cellulosimicrobium cellulans TaxID=1710 RepID=UPI001144F6CF|nr:hypothetical protein [Cellulosimicrobium cellulans]
MTETLLRSLRERLLDESEPLAGLLRKCLLLGAETGSTALRDWARKELNGYGEDDEVPEYRKVGTVLSVDSMNAHALTRGQIVDRIHMPSECWDYVHDSLALKQPIEELEQLAAREQVSFTNPRLAYAQAVWDRSLGEFQSIVSLSYVTSGSALTGILGQIRTQLVDLVADLTADTPLTALPRKEQVDAAVQHRLGQGGDVYNTTIHQADGPLAIGAKAKASTEGLTVEDAMKLLDRVQQMAGEVEAGQRSELMDAVAELRGAIEQGSPDTGDVVKKVGRLRRLADRIGVPSVSAAIGGASQALTELAVNGAFN